MGLLSLAIRKTHAQVIYKYIPHSPNSLSSHTEEVVFGPAERDGRGGNLEVVEAGMTGGCRRGRVSFEGGSTGRGTATRGSSTSSMLAGLSG